MQSKFEMRGYIEWYNKIHPDEQFATETQKQLMLTVEPELSEDQQKQLACGEDVVCFALAKREDLCEEVANFLLQKSYGKHEFAVLRSLAKHTRYPAIHEKLAKHSNPKVIAALRKNPTVKSPEILALANEVNSELTFRPIANSIPMTEAFKKQLGMKYDPVAFAEPLPYSMERLEE